MRLFLIGCEYAGTTTLAFKIRDWVKAKKGIDFGSVHDHWKIPHTSGHPDDSTPEEQEWLLKATPKFKEMHQRHSLYYHVQANTFNGPDGMVIGGAIEDAVYGPMFFGYGDKDHRLNREVVMHQWERTILRFTKDTVLIHVTAASDVIKQRMADDPHENMIISAGDIEKVKDRFAELVDWSLLPNKIVIDNSGSMEETMSAFVRKMEPFLTDFDRSRMRHFISQQDRYR